MKKLMVTRNEPDNNTLKNLFRKEKDRRLKERYHAIFLMRIFKNAQMVAELMGKDKKTILTWVKIFNEKSIEGLIRNSPPGRKSRLSKVQKEELKKDIIKNPRELGYDFSNWDGKSISYHIQKKFNVKLGTRAVQKLLHKLGLSLQRPRYKLVNTDPEVKKTFQDNLKKRWILSDPMISYFS